MAYTDTDLKKFFGKCDNWERTFFALALAAGLRRGELKTLHWSDLYLARKRVHITAKPLYEFIPKDWEERTVPLGKGGRRTPPKASAKRRLPFGFPFGQRKAKLSVFA